MNWLILTAATAATAPITPTLDSDMRVVPYDPTTWQWPQWVAVVGFVATFVTLYVQFRKNRGDEATGRLNAKMSLDKMIDERVERNLMAAYKDIDDLKGRVSTLEDALLKEREEKKQIKGIVKRLISSLLHWDRDGRVGEMPMPSESDLALLDIEPWSDTAQKRMIQQVRHEMSDEEGVESYE